MLVQTEIRFSTNIDYIRNLRVLEEAENILNKLNYDQVC